MDLSAIQAKYPGLNTFVFGDSKDLCNALTGLVRRGEKIDTCEALDTYTSGEEQMPVLGRVDLEMKVVCERFEVVEVYLR